VVNEDMESVNAIEMRKGIDFQGAAVLVRIRKLAERIGKVPARSRGSDEPLDPAIRGEYNSLFAEII
jgi:hypothetical protein